MRSLESALWYFDDHLKNVPEYGSLSPTLIEHLEPLLDRVLEAEPDVLVGYFLADFWGYLRLPTIKRADKLRQQILQLIARQQVQDAAGNAETQTNV
jgi:hypothetical protein